MEFFKVDISELKNLPKSFNVKEMEEEILDVLNESWDDSTILRRDAILADVALRLESHYITIYRLLCVLLAVLFMSSSHV